MLKRIICLVLTISLFYLLQCGLFQPEPEKGSLIVKPETSSSEPGLLKTNATLNSIKCVLEQGSKTKYNQTITTKQDGNFQVHITELEAADNYSILLYGYSNEEIIGRFAQSGISIRAGEETPVTMTWTKFKPDLQSPANANTTEDTTPVFDWTDVNGAVKYELVVALSNSFVNPVIQQAALTASGYTATQTMSDNTYYWRVRCQDSQGSWGDWSDIFSFTVETPPQIVENPMFNPPQGTYSGTQNVTITCGTSGAEIYYTINGADPTQTSTRYTGAIIISTTTLLKAKAFKEGWTSSGITSGTYIITGTVATPTFDPAPGTYTSARNVTISCTTTGVTIRYTTDNSDPTETSALYSGALTVPLNTTITFKARAYKSGSTPSSIATGTYTVTGTVAAPVFNPLPGTFTGPQNITITSATAGAAIYYTTDGTEPTQTSTRYTTPVVVNSTLTLKARAFKTDWASSAIASGTYTITGTIAAPTFNPTPGTYTSAQNVTISCTTAGTTIRYTTNGSDPTETSTQYSGPLTVPLNTIITFKARAFKSGSTPSSIATGTYTITGSVATPVFNPLPGTFAGPQNVTISSATSGAVIYYTTNGADPTQSSTTYTTAIPVSTTTTIKARAYKTDWAPSVVAGGAYTIINNTAPTASFTVDPASGTTQTLFTFDASGCTDSEDSPAVLQVRWDWENDGVWDTEFTTTKAATHQYNSEGTKTVKLEVKDSENLANIITHQLNISAIETGTVIDIDGNTYQTVKIGDQWWMAENLRVTHYRNGDPIPNITDNTEWKYFSTGAYCYYDNNNINAAVYGALYNWHVVNDNRNLAPAGWHVPSDAEWQALINYLGGDAVAGGKMKEVGTTHWLSPNKGATNESGFTARPGGWRGASRPSGFCWIGGNASFWSTTEDSNGLAWFRVLGYDFFNVYRYSYSIYDGYSIRLVRD
ncbi:MAG TPA: chitobiase/beta-hexosaminidase C-terminal domain-containing protein [bacterium]|nr:chitobiase/beta-hexosaminidase C-terminal domain-containing protein [bacterium]HPN44590.1 chitobiase/beta-hexosaminidase C-terminal domain-containing protein [bacterium]